MGAPTTTQCHIYLYIFCLEIPAPTDPPSLLLRHVCIPHAHCTVMHGDARACVHNARLNPHTAPFVGRDIFINRTSRTTLQHPPLSRLLSLTPPRAPPLITQPTSAACAPTCDPIRKRRYAAEFARNGFEALGDIALINEADLKSMKIVAGRSNLPAHPP